uniref:Putative nucleic-acid-binding protein from transposon x-element n=1 Tax=Xenopsylla cheopis TaxID=163159 RepID=A0A6M2DSN3_XENCH
MDISDLISENKVNDLVQLKPSVVSKVNNNSLPQGQNISSSSVQVNTSFKSNTKPTTSNSSRTHDASANNSLTNLEYVSNHYANNVINNKTMTVSNKHDWIQIVNNGQKRLKRSNTVLTPTKNTTSKQYWLNPIPTENQFEILNQLPDTETTDKTVQSSIIKPPPIFVHNVQDIKPLINLLEEQAKNAYSIKTINASQIKLTLNHPHMYNKILKILKDKGTELHSFQEKTKRTFKAVIKDLHHSTDIETLTKEINNLGHKVVRISNLKHKYTKFPLNIFLVELEVKPNNKDFFNIEFLYKTKILIEEKRPSGEIVQCTRCQRFGHTRNYCNRTPRCVKCTEEHFTEQCSWKNKINKDVKCVLCGGNHPASYRGCTIYKETLKRKFPPLRPKIPLNQPTAQPRIFSTTNPGISYANIIKGTQPRAEAEEPPSSYNTNNHQSNSNNDINELKNMIKTLTEQMSTMLNLLTTMLMNKNSTP